MGALQVLIMANYLGIDVGSITTKMVVINEGDEVLAEVYLRNNGRPLEAIQQALEQYFQKNGYYPPTKTYAWPNWCTYISNTGIADVKNALVPEFLTALPQDPVYKNTGRDYVYNKIYATNTYELASYLENTNDPDKGSYSYSWCAGVDVNPYNYKVTNP